MDHVAMRDNRLAKFSNSGEVGYWKVERRSVPGAKRKFNMVGGMDVLVLDVPEQGDNKDLIVSYEVRTLFGFACVGGYFVLLPYFFLKGEVEEQGEGVDDGCGGRARGGMAAPAAAAAAMVRVSLLLLLPPLCWSQSTNHTFS